MRSCHVDSCKDVTFAMAHVYFVCIFLGCMHTLRRGMNIPVQGLVPVERSSQPSASSLPPQSLITHECICMCMCIKMSGLKLELQ